MQRQTLADRFPGGFGEGVEVVMENVRWLRAAGVRLVAGTDAPNPGTGAGISMHGELRLLSRAGLGSAEALAAAISVAADAFGVADRGRIAEGHLADLVLVRGDLEEDVSRSHDIGRDLEGWVPGGSRRWLRRGRASGWGCARPRGNAGR